MAKEQKPAEATHSTGDSHAVYPTHYDVKIHTLRPEGPCKATASVNINGCFAVFVSMPSYKTGNGEYKDICFPCTKDARMEFEDAVLAAYQQALTQTISQPQQSAPDPTAQQTQKMDM